MHIVCNIQRLQKRFGNYANFQIPDNLFVFFNKMLGFLCLVFLQCLHLNVNKIVYNDDAFLFLWWFVDRVKWGKKFPDQFVVVCEKEFEGIYNVYLVDSNCILRFLNYTLIPFLSSSSHILSSHTHLFIYLPFLPHSSFHIIYFPPTLNLSCTHTFLSTHTHLFIYPYLPFLPHPNFHIPIPSFPPALILSYTHTSLSSDTHPFLPHSFFQMPSFPPTLILSYTFLSSHTHFHIPSFPPTLNLSYTHSFLSSHTHFHINTLFFPSLTLIQPFLTSSSFFSSHTHPTFSNLILFFSSHTHPTFPNLIFFLFLSHSSNLS